MCSPPLWSNMNFITKFNDLVRVSFVWRNQQQNLLYKIVQFPVSPTSSDNQHIVQGILKKHMDIDSLCDPKDTNDMH